MEGVSILLTHHQFVISLQRAYMGTLEGCINLYIR